jgi:hypothetical protein
MVASSLALAAPASADNAAAQALRLPGGYFFLVPGGTKYRVAEVSGGNPILVTSLEYQSEHDWVLRSAGTSGGTDYFEIRSYATGQCLDAQATNSALAPRTRAITWPCNGQNNQKWGFEDADGRFLIFNKVLQKSGARGYLTWEAVDAGLILNNKYSGGVANSSKQHWVTPPSE